MLKFTAFGFLADFYSKKMINTPKKMKTKNSEKKWICCAASLKKVKEDS